MVTRLENIVAAHRKIAAADDRDLAGLHKQAITTPRPRNFAEALSASGLRLITEVKRRSPSAGDLNLSLDPATVARDYQSGGAACLSVLTDEEFFGGSVADLQAARAAVTIPVLRKDFTVDERDIADARIMGADAVLLIVAALSDDELARFYELANELQLTSLFEVHDRIELERAVQLDARVIGINQRNLHTFEIEPDLALRLGSEVPADVLKVAESGIKTADEIAGLADEGFDAALIGTSLVTSESTVEAVKAMAEAGRGTGY